MTLQRLFIIHALIMLAAAVVLLAAPGLIPSAVNITLEHDSFLLAYLLGTAELALAFLSYRSIRINDPKALSIICMVFVVFHISTAAIELYAFVGGVDIKILVNIFVRIIVAAAFAYYSSRQDYSGSAA